MPLNIMIGNKVKKIELVKLRLQDKRINMVSELLAGIKVIKFYGWEESFNRLVAVVRAKELSRLRLARILHITSSNVLWAVAPFLLVIVSFGSFILINGIEQLTPNIIFVSLSLFNILRSPLTILPYVINEIISVCLYYMHIKLAVRRISYRCVISPESRKYRWNVCRRSCCATR